MNTIDLLRGMILENVLPQFVCKYRAICKSDNEKSIFHLLNESSLVGKAVSTYLRKFKISLSLISAGFIANLSY